MIDEPAISAKSSSLRSKLALIIFYFNVRILILVLCVKLFSLNCLQDERKEERLKFPLLTI